MKNNHISIAPGDFTQALSLAACGVNVVATDGSGGKAGLTVSSMCSVCTEPPVVLACVAADNIFCQAAQINNTLAISLLSVEQVHIASVFAGLTKDPEIDRFKTGQWHTLTTGSPILKNSLVSLDCQISDVHSHGSHKIYICRVVDIASNQNDPLVYCAREFVSIAVP